MGAGPSIKYVQISSQILRSRQSAILWRDARQNWVVRDWLFSWDWLLGTGCQGLVGRDWLVGLCFEDWLLGNGCYRGTGCLGLVVRDWLLGTGSQGLVVRDSLLGTDCQGLVVRDWLLGTTKSATSVSYSTVLAAKSTRVCLFRCDIELKYNLIYSTIRNLETKLT